MKDKTRRDRVPKRKITNLIQARTFIEESVYFGSKNFGLKNINLDLLADRTSKELVIRDYLQYIIHYDGARKYLLEGTRIEALCASVFRSDPAATPGVMANIACAYARSRILEGITQLQNNVYHPDKIYSINQALNDIRNIKINDHFLLNVKTVTNQFERRMAACKKLSLGNCAELAYMALDYMLRNRPDIPAEICNIKGGDHMFLVIGRAKDSDPNKPEDWGDQAYICDPWSNEVYLAKEYLTKTKNYLSGVNPDGTVANRVEPFDPERHQLELIEGYDSASFIKNTSKFNLILVGIFERINNDHLNIYVELIRELKVIYRDLTLKYGTDDPRAETIKDKIQIISSQISQIRIDFESYMTLIKIDAENNTYQAHKEVNDNLQNMMRRQSEQLRNLTYVSPDMYRKLNIRSWSEIISEFFSFRKKKKYQDIIKESESSLSKLEKNSQELLSAQSDNFAKEELILTLNTYIAENPEKRMDELAKVIAKKLAKSSSSEIIEIANKVISESTGPIKELARALVKELPEELAKHEACDFIDRNDGGSTLKIS